MSSCHSSNIQTELIELYTKLANQPDLDFGWDKGKKNAKKLGYSQKWLYNFPDLIWDSAAAVGNPFSIAKINSGMHILDIGCGTGADSCIAAMLTGSTGKVVGVDCTPAMLDKAQQNAKAAQLDNIEFYLADMTNLPIANQSIDLVISNGAINLSTNKPRTFNELFRVLKPAGRLQFADMIRLSEPECNDQSIKHIRLGQLY